MRKHLANGLALAFQFFSVVPVKKELPLEKNDVTAMYLSLPVVGALLGSLSALIVFALRDYTEVSSLLAAFVIVLFLVTATGGLHLDGLVDVGDAYFSYQDKEKRLEILGDPRIGAFGAMVLLFAVLGKIIVLSELVYKIPLVLLIVVPFFSRIGLLMLFSTTKTAKKTGLGAFFRQRANVKWLILAAFLYLLIAAGVLVYYAGAVNAALFAATFLLSLWLYRKWCLRQFGGVTGDLLGAYIEGTELLLWTVLLFFI
ncbi:adenosylcobinamide-GDP ribazoletransferase [Planococcus shenhongbingii]|uniref:Adenosylcobinamide-GDP ribazoletransferase n=1 Tax=Planococcus shenhongbingii TaxID=3058398 RepID=A0ABT8NB68_9BACL|nr:adenosylcobinamide-GDP ribazoletransferase [Planococcus sp. N017]MDN7244790.1 adenosylcobinamide-GDP ribazoletransferase [Planococcus sp. N017]